MSSSTPALTRITGDNLVGGSPVRGTGSAVRSQDPRTGAVGEIEFHDADADQVADAVAKAVEAQPVLAADRERRAACLEAAADALDADAEGLIDLADHETGLGRQRLAGELGRASGQLRRFAAVVRDGRYLDAVIDTADPDATPPRPDLRRMLQPVGPVAVFGASNFPFAFSVAGGDTASALAAGCPVLLKSHPAHPGTSEASARLLAVAADASGLPAGTISLLHGADPAVGTAMVTHPDVKAVGFTGSQRAGRALFDAATSRPEPIPVYAEMGSVNPVFVTPGAIRTRGDEVAAAVAGSMLQSMGQFCTKPGVVVVPDGDAGDAFVAAVRDAVAATDLHPLLTAGIAEQFAHGVSAVRGAGGVEVLVDGAATGPGAMHEPVLVGTDAATFVADPVLREECFGPFGIVVRASGEEYLEVARALDGMLVATVHLETDEAAEVAELWQLLAERSGRLIVDGVPTGVAVTTAQHHGGPYPATTLAGFTAVGDRAIARFLRPIAYQNAPDPLLPPELRDANPGALLRTVDGELTAADVPRHGA